MDLSVRVDQVRGKSLTLEAAETAPARSRQPDRDVQTRRATIAMVIALGIGGILTVAWTGVLLWIAGYLLGFW